MNVMELLTSAVEKDAADIFLIPGMPFSYKIGGRIIYQGDNRIMPDEMNEMIKQVPCQRIPPEGVPGRHHQGGTV